MAPKFGTSGLRGLVSELGSDLVGSYVHAFLAACDTGAALCLGRDLRDSSPRILADVKAAAHAAGCRTMDCGALPTPALALAAQDAACGAIMVTGSHIPANRNGLKFYSRNGEITKQEEAAILAQMGAPSEPPKGPPGRDEAATQAMPRFVQRSLDAFGTQALSGQRIGVYCHSAVGSDMLLDLLSQLGAETLALGRSESFVPVDTEAVDSATRDRIADWVNTHNLDALVSTDGDSDRPLLADETGRIIPGDILGQITAEALGAQTVVTPVSSNSGVTQKGFARVIRTPIGSPYVIRTMQQTGGAVVGYEANGGFLLGFEASGPAGPLPALVTRDCVLPLLATLHAARGGPLSERVAREPPVFTRSDRLQEVPTGISAALVMRLTDSARARAAFLTPLGQTETALDLTDGVRIRLRGDAVVHIRPSGNAPELRLYVEARDPAAADALLQKARARLRAEVAAATG